MRQYIENVFGPKSLNYRVIHVQDQIIALIYVIRPVMLSSYVNYRTVQAVVANMAPVFYHFTRSLYCSNIN